MHKSVTSVALLWGGIYYDLHIENGEEINMSNWTSVNDGYPNKNQCVDIWVSASDIEGRVCNCFIDHEKETAWYWNESCEDKIHINLHHVSHWMNTPQAPLGEVNDKN